MRASTVVIAERNRQLLFTLLLVVVVGGVVGYMLQKGVDKVGEREKVLGMADELERCSSQKDYLAFLHDHYPPESRMWRAPAMLGDNMPRSSPATLHVLPNGRLKVVVFAMGPGQLLQTRSYVYLPAALVDSRNRGCRLMDIRINSRKVDLVYEYIYSRPTAAVGRLDEPYAFFLGRRQWEMRAEQTP